MHDNDDYKQLIHEMKNSICLISSSLQIIQHQHPEVTDFRYWNDTTQDIQTLRQLINEAYSFIGNI